MPPKRRPENRGLPTRWKLNHGAYYYLPPKEQRHLWDGKTWFLLGHTLPEAHRAWAERMQAPMVAATIGQLFDRYLLEVVPTKAAKSQTENKRQIASLRPHFGHVFLGDLEPQHIYQYMDRRTAKVAGRREVEVLSHAFTKAVQWGLIKAHPFKGEVRLEGETARTRYVEDWELAEAMRLPARRQKGSVRMIQAYLQLKLLTGLRQRDMLLMQMAWLKEDGIHVTPSKTKKSSGKKVIYEWTPELRAAVDAVIEARPAISPFLFCNRFGAGFVDEEKGTASDWGNMWHKFMARVLAETEVKERFTEHDLRAKVGSDAENVERAKQLLSHSDMRTTERIYRRKPERIKPAG